MVYTYVIYPKLKSSYSSNTNFWKIIELSMVAINIRYFERLIEKGIRCGCGSNTKHKSSNLASFSLI